MMLCQVNAFSKPSARRVALLQQAGLNALMYAVHGFVLLQAPEEQQT